MKMFLISDSAETLIGMRLAGVDGKGVKTSEDFEKIANECLDTDVAILLITSSLADRNRDFTDLLKKRNRPLIVEIPDKDNCTQKHDSITRYIQEAMGVKL